MVGGGASGLALVPQLALDGWADRQGLIVDDHRHPVSARSWACWSSRPVSPAPAATWSSLRVHADGRDIPVRLREYRYHLVRGTDLRQVVEAAVSRAPGFAVRRGSVFDHTVMGVSLAAGGGKAKILTRLPIAGR